MSAIPIPPPLPSFAYKNDEWTLESKREDNISKLCLLNWKYLTNNRDVYLITFYNKAQSLIQQGPTCGLIAIHIISQLINGNQTFTIDELLSKAQKDGITLHGEIFSTSKMGSFLKTILPVNVRIESNLKEKKLNVIKHLTKGWPILISYDADGNHQPCLKKGHKAHWAALLGYCLIIEKHNVSKELIKNCDPDSDVCNLFHLKSSSNTLDKVLEQYLTKVNNFELFLFGKQGKSLNLIIFNYNLLIESNLNLIEMNPKYANELSLHQTNITQGLSNQALFVEPRD